jgi:hypothetical protein
MTLDQARRLGRACGLETDEECVRNIDIHCMSLFLYTEVEAELLELHKEYDDEVQR